MFQRHLGFPVPADVKELRSWSYQCGIDPGYGLRFYAGQQTLDRIVSALGGARTPAQTTLNPIWHSGPLPKWWKPEEIISPEHAGVCDADSQAPWLSVLIDRQTGLVYFMILYH